MDEFEAPEEGGVIKQTSGMVFAVSVIALILGALGICTGGMGLCGGIANVAIQGAVQDVATAGMSVGQQAAYQDLMDASRIGQIFATVLAVINLVVSAGLIGGAILAISSKQEKLSILMFALMGCVAHDLLKGFVTILNTFMMREPMAKYMESFGNMPGAKPPIDMGAIGDLSMAIGLIIGLGWIALCLGFYIWGIFTLKNASEIVED